MSMHVSRTIDAWSQTSTESDCFEGMHGKLENLGGDANRKHKRSLCRNFMEKGFCPYGKKCQFAHGLQELKCSKNDNNSYKTKICTSFERKCFCSYGPRCNFIHQNVNHSTNSTYEMEKGYRQVLYEGRFSRKSRIVNLFPSSH